MAGDDDDTIYVDVAARLDEDAAEKATGKLRDKLKSAGKGLGKVIGSDISREIGETLWDAGGEEVKKAGVNWGKSLTKGIGDAIGGSWGDIAKNLGDSLLEGTADTIGDRIKGKLKGVKDSVDDVKKSFADLKDGKPEEILKKIDENADKLPDPLKKVHDQLKPVSDAFDDIKSSGKDVIDIFAGLEIISPRLSTGLLAVARPLGEIAGAMAMVPKIDDLLKDIPVLKDIVPDTDNWNWLKQPFREMGGLVMHPSRLGEGGLYDPKTGNYIGPGSQPPAKPWWPQSPGPSHFTAPVPPGYTATPGSLDPFSGLLPPGTAMPPQGPPSIAPPDTGGLPAHTSSAITGGSTRVSLVDYTTPSLPNVSSPSDLPAAGGSVSNLYRVAQALQGTPYSQDLRNDCSGMVSQLAAAAVGLPPPSAGQRFSTSNEGQWLSQHGFAVDQGPAPANSFQVGWYDHGGGNLGHTAATLPGGVNAESGGSVGAFSLGGAVGANSPQFEHHAYLPMGAPAAGGGGARPAGFGIPGMPGLPGVGAYPPPPTQGNSYSPQTQQGLGHGQGLGVSGGAIGMAEQAGAMAAGAMSFGGGAIAAQMAEQEMNLAIQKGGQMAATAAMILPETFGLSGGQMGAPSVGQNGWYKKIVGSLIGQQTSIPNTAGATQPPKDPKQKDEGDPLSGGQPGGKPGPSGHQDDPIHVKQAPSPQGPPQGQATSAMNTTGVMSGTTL